MPALQDPVAVIGGGLAGLAAAARLAKAGHPVQLFEREAGLGGSWRAVEQPGVGLVDRAPAVLTFPAPWRDLFRKSGRPLEAELARSGHALVPAADTTYRFEDGSELSLPTERGAQYQALTAAYGESAARRWRDLLDQLDGVWQVLRPLGLERELGRHRLPRSVRRQLQARRSLAWLAAQLDEPHLAALVRSVAYRQGSVPEQTPAWVAVQVAVSRTFGHWNVVSTEPARHAGDTGRSSVLAEALAGRLALRRVAVHLSTPVRALHLEDGRVAGVRTDDGVHPAAAVIATTDPWHLVEDLLPPAAGRELRRRTGRLRPAGAPTVTHSRLAEPCAGLSETVELTAGGVPVVTYRRPGAVGTVVSRHDFGRLLPTPGAGVAWRGFRRWFDQPPVTTEVAGLYTAGPSSPAGNTPSAVILSGALASYACQRGGG